MYANSGFTITKVFCHFLQENRRITLSAFLRLTSATNTNTNSRKTGDLLKLWHEKFVDSGVSEPLASIEHILTYVLGTRNIADLYKMRNKVLSPEQENTLATMCSRRLKREPVQYILGEWDFRELTLKLKPPVFIPRPETEMLVDLVLKEVDLKNASHVLELCCGSGAICLSLLHERRNLRATAIDQSKEACLITKENAQRHQLQNRLCVIQSKVSQENQICFIQEKFDIIVSNPPYVLSGDMDNLQPEILLYEDLEALDGGQDGLDVIKVLLSISSKILNLHGKLFLEVDPSHPRLLEKWCRENSDSGLALRSVQKDFCGKERFVEIIKAE